MAYLDIADGQGRQWSVVLDRPRLLLGRDPTCDIQLPHPKVSRRHAQLQRSDKGLWILQDLNSLNHIYVDDRPVQQTILEPGKRVRIADFWLALQEPSTILEPEVEQIPEEEASTFWTGLEPRWLEQLQGFQRSLLSPSEPRQVLERLAREFCRIARPQSVAVGLAGPERYSWEVIQCEENSPPALPQVRDLDHRILDEDSRVQSWSETLRGDELPGAPPPLCLLFPMKGRSGIIGHVFIRRPRFSPLPTPVQHYLTLLATLTGLVWDNLQLAALRLSQKELEQELTQAREIQTDLFPPTFDVDPRVDIFAVNLPSERVSGDYYDILRTSPDTIAFVIADAMGHGMPAAMMMAGVRASLHMGLSLRLPWNHVFHGLDEIIARARPDTFVTGIVGLLDLRASELQLLCAGHPLPSILMDGQPVLVPRECQMRPWGLDVESPWEVGRIRLTGDWSILCYTDGITDAGVRARGAFGSQRIAAYHAANHTRSAEDLCHGLLSEVAFQPGTSSLSDDQTVLALRRAMRR